MRPILSAPPCSVEELVFKPCIARYVWAQVYMAPTFRIKVSSSGEIILHKVKKKKWV